jgi:hypothetical protein
MKRLLLVTLLAVCSAGILVILPAVMILEKIRAILCNLRRAT